MDEKPKKKMGRPTTYSDELADYVCEIIATHTDGLKILCEKYPDMPSHETVHKWRYKHNYFADQYTRAKQRQAELMAEELNELVGDVDQHTDEFGNKKVDSGMVAWRRLQADTIKWQASKLAPKIYGDKQQVTTTVTIKHEDALKALE